MRYYKIAHTAAGCWSNGAVVSEADIRDRNYDLDGWLKMTPPAVEQVPDPDERPPAAEPAKPHPPAAPPAAAVAPASHPPG